jgi:preprotein translocase subunit SecG
MVYYLVSVLYILACFLLLLVVLLQQGKGGDMASAFGGGGSQTAFGARAGATVLTKATAILGTLFMLGALAVGIMGRGGSSSIMRGLGAPTQQTAPAPAAPQQTAPAQPGASQPSTPAAPAGGQPPSAPVEQPKQ